MFNKHRQLYMPPLVLQTPDVQLEQDLLTLSNPVRTYVDTSAQEVETLDYTSGDAYFEDYNYKWE